MKTSDFNYQYEIAKTVDLANDPWFNMAGFFWINLTVKQLNKMIDILEDQGLKANEDGWYTIKCGLQLKRQ